MIPVTPENKTPKTIEKSTSTKGSEQSLEYLEITIFINVGSKCNLHSEHFQFDML